MCLGVFLLGFFSVWDSLCLLDLIDYFLFHVGEIFNYNLFKKFLILTKLTKTKHKERKLKAAREKQQVTYKGNPIHLTADLSAETLQVIGNGRVYLKCLKATIYNEDYLTWQGSHSKLMEKSKAFQTSKS